MTYKIEIWTNRGVISDTADTKREANRIAESARGSTTVEKTVITFPNGTVRICRNKLFQA